MNGDSLHVIPPTEATGGCSQSSLLPTSFTRVYLAGGSTNPLTVNEKGTPGVAVFGEKPPMTKSMPPLIQSSRGMPVLSTKGSVSR
jgi:hypothetical protein